MSLKFIFKEEISMVCSIGWREERAGRGDCLHNLPFSVMFCSSVCRRFYLRVLGLIFSLREYEADRLSQEGRRLEEPGAREKVG